MTPAALKEARKALHLTQAELAARLKIRSGGRTIRNMEAGRVPVSGPVEVAVTYMLREQEGEQPCPR